MYTVDSSIIATKRFFSQYEIDPIAHIQECYELKGIKDPLGWLPEMRDEFTTKYDSKVRREIIDRFEYVTGKLVLVVFIEP